MDKLNLQRYHDLKSSKLTPLVGLFQRKVTLDWLPTYKQSSQTVRFRCRVAGIQCAACVWLMQELVKRHGTCRLSVNSTKGILEITFVPNNFDLKGYLLELAQFGYVPSPEQEDHEGQHKPYQSLLIRFGLCAAIALNVMMFSASIYTGLQKDNDPEIFSMVTHLNFLLTTVSVLIGGSYFIGRAVRAMGRKILHFDVPIAAGIVLAYAGSVFAHFWGHAEQTYFDTVSVFIALMLLGRLLQQYFVQKHQQNLTFENSLEHLTFRVREKEHVVVKNMHALHKDDVYLLPKGSLIPTHAKLEQGGPIEIETSWINGESQPQLIQKHQTLPAGATLLGPDAVWVRALEDHHASEFFALLEPDNVQEQPHQLWQWLGTYYVLMVLGLAFVGFVFWWLSADLSKGLSVAISVAVVTCPCSLGLAVPLAKTILSSQLLKDGVVIRDMDALERVLNVRSVALDKTGTVTLGQLVLTNPKVLKQLSKTDQEVLYSMTLTSQHPASRVLFQSMHVHKPHLVSMEVHEVPGEGLYATHQGSRYFVGRSTQERLADQRMKYLVTFSKDDQVIQTFEMEECLMDDAARVVQSLSDNHREVYLISGDANARVHAMGQALGLPKNHALGEQSPMDKQKCVENLPGPLMFVGDGLNDQLAMSRADVSVLSAREALQMVQKADMYYLSESFRWLTRLFAWAKRYDRILKGNIAFLIFYNISVLTLALSGLITPLLCAIIMPASSLIVILATMKACQSDPGHRKR